MYELEPCPVCRKVNFIELDYVEHSQESRPNGYRYVGKVSCLSCGVSVISSGFHDSVESAYIAAAKRWNMAVKKWNRRADK